MIFIFFFSFFCSMLVSQYDSAQQRYYVRAAASLAYNASTLSYGSSDLTGTYPSTCPYFATCASAGTTSTNSSSTSNVCSSLDTSFTFTGRSGVVSEVVASTTDPQVYVTFNGGRSAYLFSQEHVQLEYRQRSMYGKLSLSHYIYH